MKSPYVSEFDYVLTMLANRMKQEDRGVVFLIGAGCSRQYGLPDFRELLSRIWEDCFVDRPDPSWSLEVLRDQLDKYWQAQGPEARLAILGRHLNQGARDEASPTASRIVCPGYIRLARLALKGCVKAIVNMNFDTLLEEALEKTGVEFKVSTTFRAQSQHLVVYKPHGTIMQFKARKALDRLNALWKDLERNTSHLEPKEVAGQVRKEFEDLRSGRLWIDQSLHEEDLAWRIESATGPDELRQLAQKAQVLTRSPIGTQNDLILDIANSDLFADPEEQRRAHSLLTEHDVVTVGYSGVDAKIAAALRDFTEGNDPRDRKLFYVSLSRPDPRLLLVMAERASQDLLVTGVDGAFENFMEHLEKEVKIRQGGKRQEAEKELEDEVPSPSVDATLMTRDERRALACCTRLALSIRSALNVADRSPIGIEAHAKDVYDECLKLASASGNCLTSPEKYLIYCASLFHDLGYFVAFSRSGGITGMELLKKHGELTCNLLKPRLEDPEDKLASGIFPASYHPDDRQGFQTMLLDLCRHHAVHKIKGPRPHIPSAIRVNYALRAQDRDPDESIEVPVRYDLVQALFATAEHLVREHPFLPSMDPVFGKESTPWVVEDPLLDLYLRRRENEVDFVVEGRKVVGKVAPRHERAPTRKALWLLNMASAFVQRLSKVSQEQAGWALEFQSDALSKSPEVDPGEEEFADFMGLIREALEEEAQNHLRRVQRAADREGALLLATAKEHLAAIDACLSTPAPGEPAPNGGSAAREDLKLAFDRVGNWVEAVAEEFQTRWIEDMGERLELASRLLERATRPALSGELKLAQEAAARCWSYYKANAGRAATHADLSAVAMAGKVTSWAWSSYCTQLPEAPPPELANHVTALLRSLDQFQENARRPAAGYVSSVLDAISIYTLPAAAGKEPRVDLHRPVIVEALKELESAPRMPHQGLLHHYLPLESRYARENRKPQGTSLEDLYLLNVREILYPSWRFFARNWHDGSETLLMARACLDLGSTSFRPEVVSGLRLLFDRLEPEDVAIDGKTVQTVRGHDGCTLCTSRLLYVFSYARRLFPRRALEQLGTLTSERTFDQCVGGLLWYMLARDKDADAWWGLGCETDPQSGVRSPDYLAWAARAVAFCLEVDTEVYERSGERWLTDRCLVPRAEVERLLVERWQHLFSIEPDELRTPRAEEPQTFTLGRVALAYLDLQAMNDEVRALALQDGRAARGFARTMLAALDEVWNSSLSLMSRFFLLPLLVLKDGEETGDEARGASARALVALFHECHGSGIWIRKDGPDAGSWGFNVKNTQTIVTGLMAFWRHVFAEHNLPRFRQAFAEHRPAPPALLSTPPSAPEPIPPLAGKRTRRRKSGIGGATGPVV